MPAVTRSLMSEDSSLAIRRFGQYVLDMDNLQEPLDPQPLPFEPAL